MNEKSADVSDNLFHNLIWLQKIEGMFRIVKGFHLASSHQGDILPAVILNESIDTWDIWKEMVLEKQAAAQAVFLDILLKTKSGFDWGEIPESELLQLFRYWGVKKSTDLIQIIIFYEKYKEDLREVIDFKRAVFSDWKKLSEFKVISIQDLSSIFRKQPLQGKKLQSILVLLNEIKRKQGKYWREDHLNPLKGDSLLIPFNQHYKEVKDFLIKMRYPRLNQLKNDWMKALQSADLPSNAMLEVDEFFESDEIRLVFTSDNQADLLKNTSDDFQNQYGTVFKKLFEIIH